MWVSSATSSLVPALLPIQVKIKGKLLKVQVCTLVYWYLRFISKSDKFYFLLLLVDNCSYFDATSEFIAWEINEGYNGKCVMWYFDLLSMSVALEVELIFFRWWHVFVIREKSKACWELENIKTRGAKQRESGLIHWQNTCRAPQRWLNTILTELCWSNGLIQSFIL